MCFEGNACRRTYLSERDLQAHFNHRHLPKSTAATSAAAPSATASLPATSSACGGQVGLVGVSMPPPPPLSTASQGPQAGTAPSLQFPAATSGLLPATPLAPHPATIYNQQGGAFLIPPGGGAGGSAAGPSTAAPFQPNIPPPTHHGLGPPQQLPPPPRIPPLMSVVSGRGPPLQQHRLGLNSASAAAAAAVAAAAQNTAAANMTAAFAVAAAMQQQQQAPSGLILDQMPILFKGTRQLRSTSLQAFRTRMHSASPPVRAQRPANVNALCQLPPRSLQHPTAPMWPHTTSLSNIGQNRGPV
ncbi:unnamed protein product [Schistocephalus solidus]|uniref:Zf_Hakai domain-containing protein n=1 Tax=Schistocephalus solidus TaxID=70667 RepID=A0A183TH49_SCHSO|nr:unnamed protein product [Schistocephalus solidus]